MRARRSTFIIAAFAFVVLTSFAVPGKAEPTQEVASVEREAYYTRTITAAVPPLLLDGMPPSTVCLIAGLVELSQLCGPEVGEIVDLLGLNTGLPASELPDADLLQPVPPGTLPVGMVLGQERYVSALQFQLPRLDEGERFGSFELLLRQEPVGFALESETFRELIDAVMAQVTDVDPEAFLDVLADTLGGETALLAQSITGIEACPATDDWDGGPAQNAGVDGSRVPRVDCLVGTNGQFDESNSSWVFNLTFTAQAWSTGGITGEVMPNQGIVLRPLGADNVAYGDPDLSTNWLLTLAGGDADDDRTPRIRYTVVTDDAPPVMVEEPVAPVPEVAAPAPAPAPASPPAVTPGVASPAPAPPSLSGAINARYAEPAFFTASASKAWWLMLLVPIALGGLWMLGEAVIAGPAAAGRRQGALDELMRRHGGPS